MCLQQRLLALTIILSTLGIGVEARTFINGREDFSTNFFNSESGTRLNSDLTIYDQLNNRFVILRDVTSPINFRIFITNADFGVQKVFRLDQSNNAANLIISNFYFYPTIGAGEGGEGLLILETNLGNLHINTSKLTAKHFVFQRGFYDIDLNILETIPRKEFNKASVIRMP